MFRKSYKILKDIIEVTTSPKIKTRDSRDNKESAINKYEFSEIQL